MAARVSKAEKPVEDHAVFGSKATSTQAATEFHYVIRGLPRSPAMAKTMLKLDGMSNAQANNYLAELIFKGLGSVPAVAA